VSKVRALTTVTMPQFGDLVRRAELHLELDGGEHDRLAGRVGQPTARHADRQRSLVRR
jgi:hypothetical protein